MVLRKITAPGSLVAGSVCHAASGGGQFLLPGLGSFRAGRTPADYAVPASGRVAGAPDRGRRGRGGDLGVVPGDGGMLPAVRDGIVTGERRVRADGGRRRGQRPAGADRLAVRRFRCRQSSCPQVTFAEQADGITARYRRRSVPLARLLAGFGLELAGRAAARLAGMLGIAVHPSQCCAWSAAAGAWSSRPPPR